MSKVTNLIILTEAEFPGNQFIRLNEHLAENGRGCFEDISEYAGGCKGFESAVFATATNFLDENKFLEFCCTVRFNTYQRTQLLIMEEGEISFRIYMWEDIKNIVVMRRVQERQLDTSQHPYTCGKHSEHPNLSSVNMGGKYYLVCSECDYQQDMPEEFLKGLAYEKQLF